jgi:hypothetical protein
MTVVVTVVVTLRYRTANATQTTAICLVHVWVHTCDREQQQLHQRNGIRRESGEHRYNYNAVPVSDVFNTRIANHN